MSTSTIVVPKRTHGQITRAVALCLTLFALSGCVESEEPVNSVDEQAPVADTPATGNPGGGSPPANPAPADPTPMDPAPADPGPAPTDPGPAPADPMPADPGPAPADPGPAPADPPPADPDPMNPAPPDQPPPADNMPMPVDPNPPMDPMPLTDKMLFEQTLFPEVRDPANFCAGCHGSFQIPLFAVDNLDDAYAALVTQQKVDLSVPGNSRVYLRAAIDRHNCGGAATCDVVADKFLAAIETWAAQAEPAEPPPATAAVSSTVTFADAQEVAIPRADENAIAKFLFDEGAGDTLTDATGSGMTLAVTGMEWLPEGGLRNVNGKAHASTDDSRRLFDSIMATGAYTVEAWVIPDNTAQDGPARIVTFSQGTAQRNFTLGQNAIYYQLRNRSAGTGDNGTPALEALDPMVNTDLTHVVATFDEASGRKIYINGELALAEDQPDTLAWVDNNFAFVLGNETSDDRLWQGVYKLVAIHNAALSDVAVKQNYDAGLGNLTTLRFDVTELLGEPAMIEMIASPLDSHSYLFAEPRYLGEATDVPVKNIRIAVNGAIPVASQMFRRVDTVAEVSGWQLSPLGAVIPQAMGPEMDQFQLHFELLGTATGDGEASAPPAPLPPLPDTDDQEYGVRSFSQLNDTFSVLTGVPTTNGAVETRFRELRGALPASNELESYAQPQQIAVQRLANEYCGVVANNNGRCTDVFGSCEIANGDQSLVAGRLFDRFVGNDLTNQPMRSSVVDELAALFNDLGCATGCNGDTARIALAAACSAALSSGAVTLH
ncbi:MAG: LamG domain-containing protein [Pseudomonadota bacterium]